MSSELSNIHTDHFVDTLFVVLSGTRAAFTVSFAGASFFAAAVGCFAMSAPDGADVLRSVWLNTGGALSGFEPPKSISNTSAFFTGAAEYSTMCH